MNTYEDKEGGNMMGWRASTARKIEGPHPQELQSKDCPSEGLIMGMNDQSPSSPPQHGSLKPPSAGSA